MSCNYAEGLSAYDDKGICGLPEVHDDSGDLDSKIEKLAKLIKDSNHTVFHTGAGISTSAGIPDFRGPNGVWTLEQKGQKPNIDISFEDAVPTFTHMALVALEQANLLHYVVNQNVDGLSIKSSYPFHKLSELHGNMFVDKCQLCERLFVRKTASKTVGQKCAESDCPLPKANKRKCRGKLHDTILDWEGELPYDDLELAEYHSKNADLSVCLGTTLQINPSGRLPLLTKKSGGQIVICNLQKTKYDTQASLVIHGYVDVVMKKLTDLLHVKVENYCKDNDPTKGEQIIELKRNTKLPDKVSKVKIKDENVNAKKFKFEN